MEDPIIEVNNVSKVYAIGNTATADLRATLYNKFSKKEKEGQHWALNDVSFKVERGKALGIIGHNGAGKSTLLKILGRITYPTEGRVKVRGRISALLGVGTGFNKELTGFENIYLNGTILGMSRAEINSKFDEIVAFSGIEKFLDTAVKKYSTGMRSRLAFSVAAHLDPEVMLLDEVIASGDQGFRNKSLDKMKTVSQSGKAIVFVSHSMGMVLDLCDEVMLLDKGRILMVGDPEEVVDTYLKNFEEVEAPEGFGKLYKDSALRILSLDFVRKGKVVGQAVCGRPIAFQFNYEAKEDVVLQSVSFQVMNSNGKRMLFKSDSDTTIGNNHKLNTTGKILCRFKKLPLNRGKYMLNLQVSFHHRKREVIQYKLPFQVKNGTFYTEQMKTIKGASVIPDCNWKLG